MAVLVLRDEIGRREEQEGGGYGRGVGFRRLGFGS